MPELSIFFTSPRSMTRRVRRSTSRRGTVALNICSGAPITSEPTGTITVTSFSLRTSSFIELTASAAISLTDHEAEDAGALSSCSSLDCRPSPHLERLRAEPAIAGAGGVAPGRWMGRLHHCHGKAAVHLVLWRAVEQLLPVSTGQR